jgi:hypothetical protein
MNTTNGKSGFDGKVAFVTGAAHEIAGAYRLVSLEEGGVDGTVHPADCTGALVLARNGSI